MTSPFFNLPAVAGQRIGLYGGSFNPVHPGHVAIAHEAVTRLRLNRLWWLVSPQNPLKDPSETGQFADRFEGVMQAAGNPRFFVSDIEQRLGSRNTADTLRALRPLLRRGRFVWVMGADSFAELHRWQRWKEIPATLPLAVFDRPGWSFEALSSPAAHILARHRIDASDAALLPGSALPAWAFLSIPLRDESSTGIRKSVRSR